MRYALLLTITCVVMLNPEGWFGWLDSPRPVTYEVEGWWAIYTDGGDLTVQAVTQRNELGLAVQRQRVTYSRGTWATAVCTGCSELGLEGECW